MFKSSAKKRANKKRVYLTAEERNRPQADEKMLNEYVAKIKGSWQKAVQSILETRHLLIEAKEKLP